MAIDYPKHSLSIYNLQAYKTLRQTKTRPRTKLVFETDSIPNILNKDLEEDGVPHKELDLYEVLKAFFGTRSTDIIKAKRGYTAYKYIDFSFNDQERYLIAKIERGRYGTHRNVEPVDPNIQKQSSDPDTIESPQIPEKKTIENHEAPLEPFYLGFFVPKGYRSAFFFAPKRGNINLRSLFWEDFKEYFKTVADCQIECELLLTGYVYKQWLKADITEIIAHQDVYLKPKDVTDRINKKESLGRYAQYNQKISIKPDPSVRDKLQNFIKIKDDSVVLLQDDYNEIVKNYDQVRVIATQNGKQQSFPIKTTNQDLTQQFYIDLPNLEYSSKGHPKKDSIEKEYKAVYNDYKKHLKKVK